MNSRILELSAKIVARRFKGCRPLCGLILGSGWANVAEEFSVRGKIPYSCLPALGKTTVAGHDGVLLRAELAGLETLIFQGRRHWYEGTGWTPVALPIYLLKKFGAASVVLTNAAGGIRSDLKSGDLMLIKDHINAMGANPLCGKHDGFWGKRFPDQTDVYDKKLRVLAKTAARCLKISMKEGVYAAVSGPTYETPAETFAFRKLGVDAIGMSTVPEAMLANAAGLKVLGLSIIANTASGLRGGKRLAHDEICRNVEEARETAKKLCGELWRGMAK